MKEETLQRHHRNTKNRKKLIRTIYANKLENLEKMNTFLEKHSLPRQKLEVTEN